MFSYIMVYDTITCENHFQLLNLIIYNILLEKDYVKRGGKVINYYNGLQNTVPSETTFNHIIETKENLKTVNFLSKKKINIIYTSVISVIKTSIKKSKAKRD